MNAESNLGGLLGKASRLMSNALDAQLKDLGLTSQQWSLLAELTAKGGRNQTELADALLKSKASVGSLIDYLEKKTCIARKASPGDRRETIIEITATGRALFDKAQPMAREIISRATRQIQSDDLSAAQQVLQHIIRNFEKDQ